MVAPALIGGLIGAGYGALTYDQDRQEAQRQRNLQATLESQSPWTGVHGSANTPNPSLLGNIEGGALTGATFGTKNFGQSGKGAAKTAGAAPQATPMPGGGGIQGDMPPNDATGSAGDGANLAPDAGNYVTPAAQNPPKKPADYSNPNSVGYSPWNDLNVNPNKRPAYIPPGDEAQAKPKKSAHLTSPWVNPNYA